jgi:hypothetical protein
VKRAGILADMGSNPKAPRDRSVTGLKSYEGAFAADRGRARMARDMSARLSAQARGICRALQEGAFACTKPTDFGLQGRRASALCFFCFSETDGRQRGLPCLCFKEALPDS